MEDHLVAQAYTYVKSDVRPRESYIMVLAGEAALTPEFLDTVEGAVARIQSDDAHKSERTGLGPKFEILLSDEPEFAAAIGAAFSRRIELDGSYCAEYYKSGKRVLDDFDDDPKDEL